MQVGLRKNNKKPDELSHNIGLLVLINQTNTFIF